MKILYLIIILLYSSTLFAQPCYTEAQVTSAYATGGDGKYRNDILWLTWGGKSNGNEYGTHDIALTDDSKSYASIHLGNNKYLCVEATIELIDRTQNRGISSYRPGNYHGDSMDDWYNIGGKDKNNKLIAGIANTYQGSHSHFRIKAKASISGTPVKLKGMVVADAESMDGNEIIRAKSDGKWTVLEVKKNPWTRTPYYIRKDNSKNIIQFGSGNDNTTAALAVVKFNNTAYNGNAYEVTTEFYLKGSGKQAVSIGLITPGSDLGDAPESYGSPIHTLERFELSPDNTLNGTFSSDNLVTDRWTGDYNSRRTNINSTSYQPATILPNVIMYLGSAQAQPNVEPVHGINADGDGKGTNEEDAWPAEFSRFTLKASFYQEGKKIIAKIPYSSSSNGFITGWIDFDGNGKFGSHAKENVTATGSGYVRNSQTHNEFAFAPVTVNNNGVATLEWTIPKNRIKGNTYVRLRIAEQFNEISSPISPAIDGEVEDHKIQIIAPAVINPMLKNTAK